MNQTYAVISDIHANLPALHHDISMASLVTAEAWGARGDGTE